MPLATLARVNRIRNMGIYRDFAGNDATTLRRWNLIYGFNASGKTTLSRILGSLGKGQLHPTLPNDGSFEIGLSDGTSITSDNLAQSVLVSRLFVFNSDFVEDNLRWAEGTSSPIFYIGQPQADAAAELASKEAALLDLYPTLAAAEKLLGAEDRALAANKRNTARTIAEQLRLGRRYEAPELVDDYANTALVTEMISGEEQATLQHTVGLDSHPPRIELLAAHSFSLSDVLEDARSVAATTVGTILLADLRDHDEMLGWMKAGLDYHAAHDLRSCLFCGNELSRARTEAISQAVDERFSRLLADIDRVTERVKEAQRSCIRLKEELPSPSDVSYDLRELFEVRRAHCRSLYISAERSLGEALAILSEKATSPNVQLGERRLLSTDNARTWDTDITSSIEKVNSVLASHNTNHDNFALVQESARKRLKGHYLARDRDSYVEQTRKVSQAKSVVDGYIETKNRLLTDIETLKVAVRQHGPAAIAINKLLKNYLGRGDIELSAAENAFQILRNGQPITGTLSEGEKTAIALCYFLTALEGEGRRTKDLIVAVDDPISSLDTRALNYAFNIVRRVLDGAGQLVILTHNLHFMNEAKKWLRNRARLDGSAQPTASLLFIDTVLDATGNRKSALIPMPKFIRDYESEYHFLFNLIWQFSQSPRDYEGYIYLLPNALRKVLEIFLAFQMPGPEGVADKLTQITRTVTSLDGAQIGALDRFAQTESHADNLDDLVALSSMTLEETARAVDALFALMREVAPGHLERMRRICV